LGAIPLGIFAIARCKKGITPAQIMCQKGRDAMHRVSTRNVSKAFTLERWVIPAFAGMTHLGRRGPSPEKIIRLAACGELRLKKLSVPQLAGSFG
ncbi:MAG: hypothetical protein LBD21_06460, partial [Tannerellaceae bacterium]|nr:hypothetical protein [Tannerellaceae bacterium]